MPSASRVVTVTTLAVIGAVAGGPATARAHPQPSPDRNNRYVKLTPMGDRVRLAYTVYLGDQPGAHARVRLDRNHDGTIDDREASAIGDEIANLIRPAVDLVIDDRRVAIDWATIDVGLGTPETAAGALSVDLIGWACTETGTRHHLALHDQVHLDTPGEIEVRLDETPGVTLGPRRLGGDPMPDTIATWRGDEARLTTGLELAYAVDLAHAIRPDDGRCAGGGHAAGARRRGTVLLATGAVAAVAAIAVTTVVLRRRRPRPS